MVSSCETVSLPGCLRDCLYRGSLYICLADCLPHPFVLYAPWTGGASLSLQLGQLWLNLDPLFRVWVFPLESPPPSARASFLSSILSTSFNHISSYNSFLGVNRTESAPLGPRLLRALYKYSNTMQIQYNCLTVCKTGCLCVV